MKYFQCKFEQNTDNGIAVTTGWVPERAAIFGAHVELKGEDGLWRVIDVSQPGVSEEEYYKIIGNARTKWASLVDV